MIKEKELKQQLYSSEDLLAFKPPFKKYSREAVLHFLVHELKCISIDEDYAVTIDMERYTKKGALRWAFIHAREVNQLIECLQLFGYTKFKNADQIAKYVMQFQLESGFFSFNKEVNILHTEISINILIQLQKEIPKKEKIIEFIHKSETAKRKNDYPAIFDMQLPGAKQRVLCSCPEAAFLQMCSFILHACDSEWVDVEEKFNWIESTWEDGVGYKMMWLKKIFVGGPPSEMPEQSTLLIADLFAEYDKEMPCAEEAIKIFTKHKKISYSSIIRLHRLLNRIPIKRFVKGYSKSLMLQWYPKTGGFTPPQLAGANRGSTAPLTASMSSTCSNSIYIEKYLKD